MIILEVIKTITAEVTKPSITDWMTGIGAIIGIPTALVTLITLVVKDKIKQRQMTALEKVALAQNAIINTMQSELLEFAKQTLEFEQQSKYMFDANKLQKDQLELRKEIMIKSVKPIVHIGQWDYENKLLVTLQNVGAGLGLVTKLSVSDPTNQSKNNLFEWLPKILSDGVNYSEYWTPFKGFVISPGQVIKLVEVPIDKSKQEQIAVRQNLRSVIGTLTVQVEYTDIYDNPMPITSLKLSHFLRTDNVNSK